MSVAIDIHAPDIEVRATFEERKETINTTLPLDIHREFQVRQVPTTLPVSEVIAQIIEEEQQESPFYVMDTTALINKFHQWKTNLPRVEPFYAVKCNPHMAILKILHKLGVKFDCASKGEIERVLSIPNAKPEEIIYANPCKQKTMLKHAEDRGVTMMTFDNATELYKIKENHSTAQVLLRIVTDDSQSVCKFSQKFGAHLEDCQTLLQLAYDLGVEVIGVSFHVGSGCMSVSAFTYALDCARKVFDMAEQIGNKMSILDLGGGFPGIDSAEGINFSEIAKAICHKIDELFPTTRVIAEPGRYFAAACFTLACSVIARRKMNNVQNGDVKKEEQDGVDYLYYINDGVYGSFNCLFFDHAHAHPKPLKESPTSAKCTIFGPTCDGLDCLVKGFTLPELDVGDWLYFDHMGAYTMAAASNFNGFANPDIFYISRS